MPAWLILTLLVSVGWAGTGVGAFYAGKATGHAEALLESQSKTIKQASEDTVARDVWEDDNVKAALNEQSIENAEALIAQYLMSDIAKFGSEFGCVRVGFLRQLEGLRLGTLASFVETTDTGLHGSAAPDATTNKARARRGAKRATSGQGYGSANFALGLVGR